MSPDRNAKPIFLRFWLRAAPLLVVLFGLFLCSMPALVPAVPPPTSAPFYFRDFNGVNYLFDANLARETGVGWARQPFYWHQVEPQKGHWDWSATDKVAQGALAANIHILPELLYTVGWASIKGNGYGPASNVADWQDYVDHVVARYSAAPYNIRYYQVWNEPTTKAFFHGKTDLDYIDLVYIPAAKVIRKYHCYVVFGGWPSSTNSLQQFSAELSHNNAWQWTDILDVHYCTASCWQYLYDNWIKTGKCKGLWQTEVGFNPAPNFLPGLYLPSLAFALSEGVNNPEEFKLFWYSSWGAGADANKCITTNGAPGVYVLTQHGQRLKVMNELLGAGPLSSYTQFSTQPRLSTEPANANDSAFGFQVGANRTVVALILKKTDFAKISTVSVTLSLPRRPGSVSAVTVTGERQTLQSRYSGGHLQVPVPVTFLGSACPACAYIMGYLQTDY